MGFLDDIFRVHVAPDIGGGVPLWPGSRLTVEPPHHQNPLDQYTSGRFSGVQPASGVFLAPGIYFAPTGVRETGSIDGENSVTAAAILARRVHQVLIGLPVASSIPRECVGIAEASLVTSALRFPGGARITDEELRTLITRTASIFNQPADDNIWDRLILTVTQNLNSLFSLPKTEAEISGQLRSGDDRLWFDAIAALYGSSVRSPLMVSPSGAPNADDPTVPSFGAVLTSDEIRDFRAVLESGDPRTAFDAFLRLEATARAPAGSPSRDQAALALREAVFDRSAWTGLARSRFAQATDAWEVLARAGFLWGNHSAVAIFRDVDLSVFATQIAQLLNPQSAPSPQVFYVALAALWGNPTVVRTQVHERFSRTWPSLPVRNCFIGLQFLGRLQIYLGARFPMRSGFNTGSFSERAYQAGLTTHSVSPDIQAIHDLMVAFYHQPPDADLTAAMQRDHDLGIEYIGLMARIHNSLHDISDPSIAHPNFVTRLITHILGDDLLAQSPTAIHLVEILNRNRSEENMRQNGEVLRVLFSELRDDDLRLRFADYVATNQRRLFPQGAPRFLSEDQIFRFWTAQEAFTALSRVDDDARRFEMASSLYALRTSLVGWDNALARQPRLRELFLDHRWHEALEAFHIMRADRRVMIEQRSIAGTAAAREFRNSAILSMAAIGARAQNVLPPEVEDESSSGLDRLSLRVQVARRAIISSSLQAMTPDEALRELVIQGLYALYRPLFSVANIDRIDATRMISDFVRQEEILVEDPGVLRGVELSVFRRICEILRNSGSGGGRNGTTPSRTIFGGRGTVGLARSIMFSVSDPGTSGRVTASTTPSTGQGVPAIYGGTGLPTPPNQSPIGWGDTPVVGIPRMEIPAVNSIVNGGFFVRNPVAPALRSPVVFGLPGRR